MKKLFISISAAFVFILSCIIPFTASAVYNNRPTSKEAFNYDAFIQDTDSYIFMNFDNNSNSDTCACLIRIPNSVVNNTDYVSNIDNVYTINCPSNMFQMCIKTEYVNNSEYNLSYIKLDFNTNTVEFKFYNNGQLTTPSAVYNSPYYGMNEYQFYNFESDINTNFRAIEVDVFPELDENFNYMGSYEGYTAELNTLQVDITNNTGYNYEYAIMIQPKDAEMNVGLPDSDNNTFFWGSSNVTYALVKDEWIQRDAHDVISAASNSIGWLGFDFNVHDVSAPITVYCPSAWHYLPHHELKREWIYYEQMKLKKGVDYTFKVYVYNITQNAPLTYSDDLVYPAFNNLELVYSKDFSVARDTVYDADSVSNGAYSFDNTSSLGSQFDKMKGFQEPNGNIKIFDNNDIKSSNARIGSNASFNSLISNSSSFLSLLRNVLYYLPDWLSALLFGGLFAFVLAAIIKKFC